MYCAKSRYFTWSAYLVLASGTVIASPVLISVDPAKLSLGPNEHDSVLVFIDAPNVPLFGYSIAINTTPTAGAVGFVEIDLPPTNFFDAQNLITAGGATRDPVFSQILGSSGGGAFITTNTVDNSAVLAVSGVNDILAEVSFHASPDAYGDFEIMFGQATVFSDQFGHSVAFDYSPTTIHVVPEPTTLTLLGFSWFAFRVFIRGKRRILLNHH